MTKSALPGADKLRVEHTFRIWEGDGQPLPAIEVWSGLSLVFSHTFMAPEEEAFVKEVLRIAGLAV